MAHELVTIAGKTAMAYVGDKPWHGLGQELSIDADIATWKQEAGMNWEIKTSSISYQTEDEESKRYPEKRVLYRGDTGTPLSIVSNEYNIVQPGEVLDFFDDLVALQGMKLHTAGVLFGGRRFWALADTGRAADVLGNDRIKGMLLLTTSCDGSLATTAQFTSVRVVCNNTLKMSLESGEKSSISHRSEFNPSVLKDRLGVFDKSWESFREKIGDLSKAKVSDKFAKEFIFDVFAKDTKSPEDQPRTTEKSVSEVMRRYRDGMGTNSAYGTLWGVLNSITEHIDHSKGRSRSSDSALWSTWYGNGANTKDKAFDLAMMKV